MYINDITELDENKLLRNIPYFLQNNINYFRKEKHGNFTIRSNTSPFLSEMIINNTSMDVIKLINGERSVNDIILDMKKIYNDIELEVIKNDIFKILFNYTKINIIEWKEGNVFMNGFKMSLDKNYELILAQDDDLLLICNFFKNFKDSNQYIKCLSPLVTSKEYEDEFKYREKLFSYVEEFILLKKNGILEGVLAIKLPIKNNAINNSTVSEIGLFMINKKEYNDVIFSNIINFAKEVIQKESVCNITKIRFREVGNDININKANELEKKLEALGFCNVSILENELNNQTVKYLDFMY